MGNSSGLSQATGYGCLPLEAEPGETVTFERVLVASSGSDVAVGVPLVEGASVTAEVLRHGRDKKVVVFKRKRRKGYRRKKGHRQGSPK